MATVDSSSTYAQARAAYLDNLSYAEDNSTAKASAFITAAEAMLFLDPMQTGRDGTAFVIDKQSVREALTRARQWLSARGGASASAQTSRSRHLSFEDFRS
jgi:hypothetical protein